MPVNDLALLGSQCQGSFLGPRQDRLSEVSSLKIAFFERRMSKIGSLKVRRIETNIPINGPAQVCAAEVSTREVDIVKIVPTHTRLGQVCISEGSVVNFRTTEERPRYCQIAEIVPFADKGPEETQA